SAGQCISFKVVIDSSLFPGLSRLLLKGRSELVIKSTFGQIALQMRDVGMVTTKAELFVKHPEKDSQDGVTTITAVRLAVDVEQKNVRSRTDRTSDIGGKHGVFNLLVEEVDGLLGLAIPCDAPVFQQIGENFDEVRFTRS